MMVDEFGTSCIACKSTTGTKLYEEVGTDAFLNDWETYAAGEKTDWYDCGCATRTGRPAVSWPPAVWPLLRSARPSSSR